MPTAFTGSIMKVGNSLTLVLPKTLCDNYEIEKGDSLTIVTTDNGFFVPVKQKEHSFIKKELENALKSLGSKKRGSK